MIGAFLRAWVASHADIRGEVGDRVYPQVAPNDTKGDYPYLVFNTITDSQLRTLGGPAGNRYEQIQIDIVGVNYTQLKGIAAMLIGGQSDRRLDGYSVTLGDPVLAGITVREGRHLDTRDAYDDPIHDESQGVRRVQVDFKFTYEYLAAGSGHTVAGTLGQIQTPIIDTV